MQNLYQLDVYPKVQLEPWLQPFGLQPRFCILFQSECLASKKTGLTTQLETASLDPTFRTLGCHTA